MNRFESINLKVNKGIGKFTDILVIEIIYMGSIFVKTLKAE